VTEELNTIWADIDDLENYRHILDREFEKSKSSYERTRRAIDERINMNLKAIKEILAGREA
jgi:hypothetical protein